MPKLDLVNITLLCILVAVSVACVILMITNKKQKEGFTDDTLMEKLNQYFPEVSNEERDAMYAELKDSLDDTCKSDMKRILISTTGYLKLIFHLLDLVLI